MRRLPTRTTPGEVPIVSESSLVRLTALRKRCQEGVVFRCVSHATAFGDYQPLVDGLTPRSARGCFALVRTARNILAHGNDMAVILHHPPSALSLGQFRRFRQAIT